MEAKFDRRQKENGSTEKKCPEVLEGCLDRREPTGSGERVAQWPFPGPSFLSIAASLSASAWEGVQDLPEARVRWSRVLPDSYPLPPLSNSEDMTPDDDRGRDKGARGRVGESDTGHITWQLISRP